MPWTLSIWHIDVLAAGDSTLIVARNGALVRSVLIDGGLVGNANQVHARVVQQGVAPDVVVVTHYDADHLGGVRSLLAGGNAAYANARIYDQGEAGSVRAKRDRNGAPKVTRDAGDPPYELYRTAVGARVRPTAMVLPGGPPNNLLAAAGYRDPDWLLNRDVMWHGYAGPAVPAGGPSLTCIAVNEYVQGAAGNNVRLTSGLLGDGDRKKNAQSLAFLLTFGNFRYYIGGDLESRQEDGSDYNPGTGNNQVTVADRANSLMIRLNAANNVAGRVHAMKTSHHGSAHSSSPAFLNRLRPQAAFISCGTDNIYGHPEQRVVDTLEALPNACSYFLTGEAVNGATILGNAAEVAGAWPQGVAAPTADGDIELEISEAQAGQNPPQFDVNFEQPVAGTNRLRDPDFAYAPHHVVNVNF